MKNIELRKSVIGLLSCYNYLDPLIDLATRTTTCPTTCPTTWNLPGPSEPAMYFKSAMYDLCQPSAGPGNK